MGSVNRRPDGKYRARYRDHAGKEHAKHFDRKIDAERWVIGQEAALDRGEHIDPRAGRIRLAGYADTWLANQLHIRAETRRGYESALRLYVKPAFGHRPLASVQRSDVQSLVNAWAAAGFSAQSIRNSHYKTLRVIFKSAVLDGLIPKSPCVAIKLPQVVTKQIVPLTVGQVQAIAGEIEPRCRAAVLVGAGCGLRPSETTGLTEDSVLWMTRQIAVTHQLVYPAKGLAPLKTGSSKRVVPAPGFVLEALSAHVAAYGVGEHGVLFTAMDLDAFRAANGMLNVTRHNDPGADTSAPAAAKAAARESRSTRPLGYQRYRDAFASAVERVNAKAAERDRDRKAGRTTLPPLPSVPADASPHALRHAYASALIDGGESVVVVARRMGHKNPSMTLDVYSHLFSDSEERTRAVMDAAWNFKIGSAADPVRTSGGGQVSGLRR